MLADPDSRQIYVQYGQAQYFDRWTAQRHGKASSEGFYASADDIVKPTWDTWSDVIGPVAVVEFYAPWCSHCQQMVPAFKRTALLLEGQVVFAAVNCEDAAQKRLCMHFQIQHYPTVRLFVNGDVEEFTGAHDALYTWITDHLHNELVTIEGPDDFETRVVQSREPWLVDFSAGQWCGPCQVAKSRLRSFAKQMVGRLRVGIINCDAHGEFCASLGVEYYPALRAFGPGSSAGSELVYANERQFPVVTTLDVIASLLSAVVEPKAKEGEPEAAPHDEL